MGTHGEIRFGTDGWRGVIGFDYHAANVAAAARAYGAYLRDGDRDQVLIGYDTRFNSSRFAGLVAHVLVQAGLRVAVSEGPLPAPALSFAVRHHGAAGGVMLTASHNPPAYHGFKLKGPYGGSATPDIYRAVAERLGDGAHERVSLRGLATARHDTFDIRDAYFDALERVVHMDDLAEIEGAIVHDAMGGSGGDWLAAFVERANLPLRVEGMRTRPDPMFYGVNPEPLPSNLAPAVERMKGAPALFATATDGDADRLGVVLPGGAYFNSHQIFAVLLDLMASRGESGRVVKTFTVSRVIERIAANRGLEVVEKPVGFKHIVDEFLAGGVMIGGEESGGIGIGGHIPERDGIANSLLLLEAMARADNSLSEVFAGLEREARWAHAYDRLDLHLDDPAARDAVVEALQDPPTRFAGREVTSVERLDGVKLNLSGGAWLLFRPSGTEPVLRIYCEAQSEGEVREILDRAERFAQGEVAPSVS